MPCTPEGDSNGRERPRQLREHLRPLRKHRMKIRDRRYVLLRFQCAKEIEQPLALCAERTNPRQLPCGLLRTSQYANADQAPRTGMTKAAAPLYIGRTVGTARRKEKIEQRIKHEDRLHRFSEKLLQDFLIYDMINAEKRYIS